jgi:hypothetical protein
MSSELQKSGRGGLAAKQIPPRPGQAPALGLRADGDGFLIVSRTAAKPSFLNEESHPWHLPGSPTGSNVNPHPPEPRGSGTSGSVRKLNF